MSDLSLSLYILLSDAVFSLNESAIDAKDLYPSSPDLRDAPPAQTVSSSCSMLAYTTYVRRISNESQYCGRGRGGYHHRDGRGNARHTDGLLPNYKTQDEHLDNSEVYVLHAVNLKRLQDREQGGTAPDGPRGRFYVMGSQSPQRYENPILYDLNPTSTVSISAAAYICDILSISLYLRSPSFFYEHGWGCEGLKPTPVLSSWGFSIQYLHHRSVYFRFAYFTFSLP